MKILLVDPDPVNPYGAHLADALSTRGDDVEFVTAIGNLNGTEGTVRRWNVAPESAKGRYLRKMSQEVAYLGFLFRRLQEWRPDIVHFEWFRVPIEIGVLGAIKRAGFALVWTVHNIRPHETGWLDRLFHRTLYSIPDGLVVHTEHTAAELRRQYPSIRTPISIVRPGLWDTSPGADDPMAARVALGIPVDATVFLLYGQLRPYKGLPDLLEAFRRTAATSANAHLVIAGRATEAVAQDMVERLGGFPESLARRITCVVPVDAFLDAATTRQVFGAADCVVLPYREASCSGVLHQALGFGRAALLPSLGSFKEILRDGETAFFYTAGDIEALAETLRVLSSCRERIRSVGQRAMRELSDTLSWQRAALDTRMLYETVLASKC